MGEYVGPKKAHHFLLYAAERLKRENERLSYMAYMTDQAMYYAQGMARTDRWLDSVIPQEKDTRTAEDIIADVVHRAGLKEVSE